MRIEYRDGGQPHVFVLDPPLEASADDAIPHMYGPTEPCLYYPGEFDPGREFIADTIVPWASEWLLFYELWLITKGWHGGGIHPGVPEGVPRPGTPHQFGSAST